MKLKIHGRVPCDAFATVPEVEMEEMGGRGPGMTPGRRDGGRWGVWDARRDEGEGDGRERGV